MAKIKLDLHDIFNKGGQIEAELRRAVEDAMDLGEQHAVVGHRHAGLARDALPIEHLPAVEHAPAAVHDQIVLVEIRREIAA